MGIALGVGDAGDFPEHQAFSSGGCSVGAVDVEVGFEADMGSIFKNLFSRRSTWVLALSALSIVQAMPRAGELPPPPLGSEPLLSASPISVTVPVLEKTFPHGTVGIGVTPLGPIAGAVVSQGFNIANVLNGVGPTLTQSTAPGSLSPYEMGVRGLNWDIGMALPGALNLPSLFTPTNFNPSFTAPFYSSLDGLNATSFQAPWNQNLPMQMMQWLPDYPFKNLTPRADGSGLFDSVPPAQFKSFDAGTVVIQAT